MRRLSSTVFILWIIGCSALLAAWPDRAYASDYKSQAAQELGISLTFGRWPDGVVRYVYNPTGAPTVFANDTYFVSLLQAAMAEIEGAAGVTFDYQGIDTNATIADLTDGVVTVGWEDIGGAAGQAGPGFSCTNQDRIDIGYCNYVDGTVRFNNNILAIDWDEGDADITERNFSQVAMHELLHLLGIGHSEQQQSIMYADPYNNLSHLRADDIDALRSLYGRPAAESLAGIYVPPNAGASPLVDSFISRSNDAFTEITTIDGSEIDSFVYLAYFVPGGFDNSIQIVATDPQGYYYDSRIFEKTCGGGTCGSANSFAQMATVFTFPGVWTVYVIIDDLLVATESVTVTTSPTFNKAPDSYLTHDIIRGQAPLTVNLKLTVTGDNEGDAVDASWHIPTVGEELLDSGKFPGSAGVSARSVTFDTPGEHEIYVTVNDDWMRYGAGGGAAGPGFRTLYRVVVRVTDAADDVTTFGDVTGDMIPDVATFTGIYSDRPRITVFSGASGAVDSIINYINVAWRGVALGTVRDANQDGTADDPAVAMLADNKTTQKIRVETRNLANRAVLNSTLFFNENWRARDVVVVDDLNGDGNTNDTAIAVLAERISDGRIQVQLRNFSTGALISNVVYLNARWSAVAAAVADRSAVGPVGAPPLIAVIAENPTNGKRLMQSRIAGSGAFDRNIKFLGAAWNYHDVSVIHDANGDGTNDDPVWQVFATRDSDLVMRVQSRFVNTGAFDTNTAILNANWEGFRLDSALDIDGNSDQEMAFSAIRRSDGVRRIHIKDFASGSTTVNIAP